MPRPKYAAGSTHGFVVQRALLPHAPEAYLAARLSIRLGWARDLLAQGCVRANGQTLAPGGTHGFMPGDAIAIVFPAVWPPHLAPTPMPLAVLYEDDAVLVLDKPAGVVVHPARGHMQGETLQNGVLHRYREEVGAPGVTIGAAHRLDRDTSGVIVFSRTQAAYRHLTRQFAAQHPHKEYLALVDGAPAFAEASVEAPLGADPRDASRGAVVPLHEGGKRACTDLYVEEAGADWALVRACPRTGRPHQVRLQGGDASSDSYCYP